MQFDFDRIADVFDSTRTSDPRLIDSVAKGIADLLGEGSKLLDIGTGTGRFLSAIEKNDVDGYGLDLSRNMLMKAREKGIINLVQGNATKLPFQDRRFDGVLMTSLLHLVDDWKEVIREACRVSNRAVISIDVGRKPLNPFLIFKEIMRERGFDVPQKGPYETDLSKECRPNKSIDLIRYQEILDREDMLAKYEQKSFTFQSSLTAEENHSCVEEMRRRFEDEKILIDWDVSLLVWTPEELIEQLAGTTFCYPY
ncbi:MAG: methyltransferase domain-containing protein [Thermoplasmata archaeon]|nr:methyltransferase domain-containing protein [Thermoplasmata archaeon]